MSPSSKKSQTKKSFWDRLVQFIPVWVQIVICIGTIAVAAVPFVFPRILSEETPTPTSALPTDVLPPAVSQAEEPTETPSPIPAPSTPELVAPVLPPPVPGEDWARNCIDTTIWSTFLADKITRGSTPCYELAQWGITGESGKVIFVTHKSQSRAVEYGIFTPWQDWKGVEFSVHKSHLENSEVWVGFFEEETVYSNGIVFVIQPDDVIDIRQLPVEDLPVNNVGLPFADGVFNVDIVLREGKFKASVDGQGIISEWPLSFAIKYMFVGYRSLPSTNLDASVSDLRFIK